MSDGLEELDQTHAIFSAMGSFWWRVLMFFVLCVFGHFVGLNCAGAARLVRDVLSGGLGAISGASEMNPFFAPLSWMWTLLAGCEHPAGLLQLFALGVAFLFVWLSEDRYIHGFAIAILTEPIHTFLVEGRHLDRPDFLGGMVVLAIFELGVGGAYWWFLGQRE